VGVLVIRDLAIAEEDDKGLQERINLEIRTWTRNGRNYIFACASPQARDTAIWKQLRAIRDDYLKKQTE